MMEHMGCCIVGIVWHACVGAVAHDALMLLLFVVAAECHGVHVVYFCSCT